MMICKLEEPSVWISQLKLRMSNDVEKNPGPKSPSKRSDPEKKKSKLKRSKSSVRDAFKKLVWRWFTCGHFGIIYN